MPLFRKKHLFFCVLIGLSFSLVVESARASFTKTITDFVVTILKTGIRQESFRFYSPAPNLTPMDPWPPGTPMIPENASITESNFPPVFGEAARIRIGLKSFGFQMGGNKKFKLQYAKLTSGQCSNVSVWSDLGDPFSTVADWRGFAHPGLVDKSNLPLNLLGGGNVLGTYQDKNPTPFNPPMPPNSVVEYDWSIQNNISDPDGSVYCFRMANNDGSGLNWYNRYPEIKTPNKVEQSATNVVDHKFGGTTTLTNNDSSQFIVSAPPGYMSTSCSFNLFSFDYNNYLDQISSVTPTGKVGANPFVYRLVLMANGGVASESFDKNLTIKIKYNEMDISSTVESSLQIFKFNGEAWNGLDTTLDTVNKLAIAQIASASAFGLFGDSVPTPTPSSESTTSGAGGGGSTQVSVVELKGFTYPGATVNILRDSTLRGSVVADKNGLFTFSESGLSGGDYRYGLYSVDSEGRKSNSIYFLLTTSTGSITHESGIMMSPTVSIGKEQFSAGEEVAVSGEAQSLSTVTIELSPGNLIYKTTARSDGFYSFKIPTKKLEKGKIYSLRASAKLKTGEESKFSEAISFGLGIPYQSKTFNMPDGGTAKIPDFNGDNKINIVDISIMLYWFKKPVNKGFFADLNGDGMVDIADFSILVFYWTG